MSKPSRRPRTTRHRATPCPECGTKLDSSTVLRGRPDTRPKPGDISVCAGCGAFLTYTEEMAMRRISLDELVTIPAVTLRLMGLARAYFRSRVFS